jgi:hypothetical protein
VIIKSDLQNIFNLEYDPSASYGIELTTVLDVDPADIAQADAETIEPNVEFGKPLQDWFEMALKTEEPARRVVRASWGEDEDETEEEPIKEEPEEDEPDPFEDFDEDDFDDDFDDDFEEELDDEYEIEPADDGLAVDPDADLAPGEILDEEEEIGPSVDDAE